MLSRQLTWAQDWAAEAKFEWSAIWEGGGGHCLLGAPVIGGGGTSRSHAFNSNAAPVLPWCRNHAVRGGAGQCRRSRTAAASVTEGSVHEVVRDDKFHQYLAKYDGAY